MGNASTKSSYPKSLSGSTTNSKRLHWNIPGLPLPPGKPILIPGTENTQPDIVSIKWDRSSSNGGSAIVGYLVEHRRMGSPHWVRAAPILCTLPELTLSGLEPGWRYQFRVRAQNALGLSEPSELSDPLTVTLQRSIATAPIFDLELKDVTALENDQTEFTVRFSGMPLPKIAWFKDGFEIFSSRRTRIVTENGKSSLLIHQTSLSDEGEIKCTATNRLGHTSTRGKLVLEALPKVRLPRQYEDGLLFEQGATIRLKVSLAGRPLPVVVWFRDGATILEDERHVLEGMGAECVLKIIDAERSDRGEYTVRASNHLGEDATSFLLNITDRPSEPGKPTILMTLGRSVTLTWKEPEDDGGCQIGAYTVEHYRIGWEVWLKSVTCRELKTTLTELIEGSEYRFRVKAENPYGISRPSEESDTVFIPDPKRGITEAPSRNESHSQRDTNKANREKREVSFAEPVLRARSLSREIEFGEVRGLGTERGGQPAKQMDNGKAIGMTKVEGRPELPSRTKRLAKQVSYEEVDANQVSRIRHDLHSPGKSPISNLYGYKTAISEFKARSMSRERSLSPLPMPKIQESHEELLAATPYKDSSHLILQKQRTFDSLTPPKPALVLKKQNTVDSILASPSSPRENYDNMVHGSSEFMLVLYPDEEENRNLNRVKDTKRTNGEGNVQRVDVEEYYAIPPPLSLSLPELISIGYEDEDIQRDAMSSTELLEVKAMERYEHAVSLEEAELAKRKAEAEKRTGELAGLTGNASAKGEVKIRINSMEAIDTKNLERRLSIRRRLSNSGTQNAWQAKRERRRSSEGQSQLSVKRGPQILQDASSDSELTSKNATAKRPSALPSEGEKLHRWDEKNMPLTVEKPGEPTTSESNPEDEPEESVESSEESSTASSSTEESTDSEDLKFLKARIMAQPIIDEQDTYHPRGRPVQHFVNDAPAFGIPPRREPPFYDAPSGPNRPLSLPSLTSNAMPKSILKKRTDTETTPLNQFGKPTAPEKPLRKSLHAEDTQQQFTTLQQPLQESFRQPVQQPPQPPLQQLMQQPLRQPLRESLQQPPQQPLRQPFRETPQQPLRQPLQQQPRQFVEPIVTLRKRSLTSIPDATKSAVISESDIDNSNVLSAAEIARTRRRQLRQASVEEDSEANMAVISHYTEIVREHSVTQTTPTHYLKRENVPVAAPQTGERSSTVNSKVTPMSNGSSDQRRTDTPVKLRRSSRVEQDYVEERKPKSEVRPLRESVDRDDLFRVRRSSASQQRETRPSSRADRRSSSRNASRERREQRQHPSRDGRESRPSSRSSNRGLSQEKGIASPVRSSRPSSRAREGSRSSREKSIENRKSSRSSSRSNSRDRYHSDTPDHVKMERLQQALESRKYRTARRYSESIAELNATAEKQVGSTMSYVTDLTLLTAAVYVYFMKNEVLALPFIGLVLYRQIQEELYRRLSKWRRHYK